MLLLLLLLLVAVCQCTNEWDLPVFPAIAPHKQFGKVISDKLIPRHIWMAVRDLNTALPGHIRGLFERNPSWEVHICSNDMKDEFMNKTFAGTSFLWAYYAIDPRWGAARADLWRYAVLWAHGGMYIDDDSDMKKPLDDFIEKHDSLIVSYEKNGFNGDRCFIPNYKLSDVMAYRNPKLRDLNVFEGYVLPNWAIISAPRHPIIAQTMINAVEVIRAEYIRDAVMRHLGYAHKWEQIMCATGPTLLTASAREVIFNENATNAERTTSYDNSAVPPGTKIDYKLACCDFRDYGGRFKAYAKPVKFDANHYMRNFTHLLHSYLPEKPITDEKLRAWQGRLVQGQNGKAIYLIDEGKKRGFPNWDTFASKYRMDQVKVISDEKIREIPDGEWLPSASR